MTQNMKKENYIAPEVTEVAIRAELGFAFSKFEEAAAMNDPYEYEKLTW